MSNLLFGAAWAADKAAQNAVEGKDHGFLSDPATWVAVSFVLFFVLLGKILWTKITEMLDKRSGAIARSLADAERLRERYPDEGLSGVSPRFVINALSAAITKSNAKSLTTMEVLLALKDAIDRFRRTFEVTGGKLLVSEEEQVSALGEEEQAQIVGGP